MTLQMKSFGLLLILVLAWTTPTTNAQCFRVCPDGPLINDELVITFNEPELEFLLGTNTLACERGQRLLDSSGAFVSASQCARIQDEARACCEAPPTPAPTPFPTPEPTPEPTTAEPTDQPTAEPTDEPTAEPTAEPTPSPTPELTPVPTGDRTTATPPPTPSPTTGQTPPPTPLFTTGQTPPPTPAPTTGATPPPTQATTVISTSPLTEPQSSGIIAMLEKFSFYSSLLTALDLADLTESLFEPNGPYILFAPTDPAFDALPDEILEAVLLPENEDFLVELLQYHIVRGQTTWQNLQSGFLLTLAGPSVSVIRGRSPFLPNVDIEFVQINDSRIVVPNFEAPNGIIHGINAVLIPPGFLDRLFPPEEV